MLTQSQFDTLIAQGYQSIPLVQKLSIDLDTPLSIYMKFCQKPYTYLLESVHCSDQWGRYSIIGLPAKIRYIFRGNNITKCVDELDDQHYRVDCPWTEIRRIQSQYKAPSFDYLPRFSGGLVGYFAYDTVRFIEPKLSLIDKKPDSINTPDIALMVSEELMIFDNLSNQLFVVVHAKHDQTDALRQAKRRLDDITTQLGIALKSSHIQEPDACHDDLQEKDFISDFNQDAYCAAVQDIKRYIIDGDALQVVLSQRLSAPFSAPPISLYRSLRALNPSPYMYFLDLDDFQIVGSSPEILSRLEGSVVTVRPIAGTRPRGHNTEEDIRLEQDLLQDEKECAEHLMLIDLGRNDIGRIADAGSVKLTSQMIIERYSHVMHIVSNVVGKLKPNMDAIDVLLATFPAGTVSGAPKIRAMEIIHELEPIKRGIYSGAVGYLSWTGNMDTAIAIRTAILKDQRLYIQAGAGIVFDSIAEREWQETINKASAIFKAACIAARGLKYPCYY